VFNKKEKKEKPKYKAYVGWGDGSSYFKIYSYEVLDNKEVKLETTEGIVMLTPGTPCMIQEV